MGYDAAMAVPAPLPRSSVRTLLGAACLCGVAVVVPSASAAPPSAGGVVAGQSAADRRQRIDALTRQLEALRREAEVDAAQATINAYRRYSADRLANPKDRITVSHLLDIVRDNDVAIETREAAAQTILSKTAVSHDPDLEVGASKGWARPRARFSKRVLPMLVDAKEEMTRVFANQILLGLWPGAREPEITGCNPRNRKSAGDAKAAWEKNLGKS